ncbi:hypothetical protein D3C83_76120 [compost metagenome]
MVHGDRLDVAGARVQCVDEADVTVPAEPEDVRHLLADQVIDDDARAVARLGGLAWCVHSNLQNRDK